MDRVMVAKIEIQIRSVTDFELLKLSETLGATPNELLGHDILPADVQELVRHLKR